MEFIKCTMSTYFGLGRSKGEINNNCKAGIVEEGCDVCTLENKENCYNPDSIRQAFKPLAVYAKIFGLFPRYDLSFVSQLQDNQINMIHILNYCYTGLMMCIMAGGALMCTIKTPTAFSRLQFEGDNDDTDFYVSMAVVYLTLVTGIMALFTFPTANGALLALIDHFTHLDKILRFDGRCEERSFAKRVLAWLVLIFVGTIFAYIGFYILEPSGNGLEICYTDIIMAPIMTISGTALLIPTAILIFFLHALRIRLFHFNQFMETKLRTITPSYSTCSGYFDYGMLEKPEKDVINQTNFSNGIELHIEKLRLLYNEMGNLASEISYLFGSHLARDYVFSTLGLILYTYVLLYVDYEGSVSNYTIVTILEGFLLVKLFMMSYFAQRIQCFGCEARKMLNRIAISRISQDCGMQIQMFLNALDTSPIRISAAGYFTIDRSLLTSLLGAITTYFIILIQFKVGDVKQELIELTKSCKLENKTVIDKMSKTIFPTPRFG